jgi:hypothetical protein
MIPNNKELLQLVKVTRRWAESSDGGFMFYIRKSTKHTLRALSVHFDVADTLTVSRRVSLIFDRQFK